MKNTETKNIIIVILTALCTLAFVMMWVGYSAIFKSNVNLENENIAILIPEKSTVKEVALLLKEANVIENERTFLLVSELKRFHMPSKGGRYTIQNEWSNNDIINTLRIGSEVPVKLTFNNIRTQAELSARLAQQLRIDSAEIMELFNDYDYIHDLGFDFETIIAIFIPNTYEVFWTIKANDLFKRMKSEYDAFWTQERLEKAKKADLSPLEVIILASIVEEETLKSFEKPIIAGVYINRLKKGIPLQACPTLKFALNDFTIKRILYKHMKIESPYNTYKYKGLPPGPVRVPNINSIDAVLNYQEHDYLFFSAKEDFSGTHYFSKTLREHNTYAERYHQALNKQKIYK